MRLTTLDTPNGPRVGVLDGSLADGVVRLLDAGPTLLDVIRGGQEALADVARGVRSGDRDEWYEQPLFYFANPASIVAPYADVPIPPYVTQYDYELEVGAVVGAAGSDLTPERAARHILGYTIFNDWTARDLQMHEFTFPMGPSKSKDAAITLGPWLVTADELADHVDDDGRLALRTEVRRGGKRTGGDITSNMSWSFAELVAHASRGTVVRPGDVLGSGTCGTGCLAELKRTQGDAAPDWLRVGDVVRIEVEQLGFIENRLVPSPEPIGVPRGRRRIRVEA